MTPRDEMLVTMGARAAYMESRGDIKLPSGVQGEHELASYVSRKVGEYMNLRDSRLVDITFDEFIETALINAYGHKEIPKEIDVNEFDKLTVCMSSMLDEIKKVIRRPDGIVNSADYAMYKAIEYLELQIIELDKRTRKC